MNAWTYVENKELVDRAILEGLKINARAARTWLSKRLRFRIFKRDGYRCRLCGSSARDGVQLEVDHIIAIANGGSNDESNLWTLCFDCNRGKSAEML